MNRRSSGWAVAAVAAAALAQQGVASDFRPFGPRATAMGGAGVARPEAAYSVYYNQAALAANPDLTDVSFSLGVRLRDTGLADKLDSLLKYNWQEAKENPTLDAAVNIVRTILSIESTDGMVFSGGGALSVKAGRFGAGAYPSGQAVIFSTLDKDNILNAPIETARSFARNLSTLSVQGLGLVEVPIGYGWEFDIKKGKLFAGGAVKYIQGLTWNTQFNQLTVDSDTAQNFAEDAQKMSGNFGVDLSVLYQSESDAFAAGLLLRNLNSPSFKTASPGPQLPEGEFDEKAQIRAGVAYNFTERFYGALDLDVTSNQMLIGGAKSRQLSAGVGYDVAAGFAIRGGLMKDIELEDSPLVFSLGLALGSQYFHFDVVGNIAGEQHTYSDYTFYTDYGVMLALGGTF